MKASKAITESSPVFSPRASQTTIPVGLCLALDRNDALISLKAVIPCVEIGNLSVEAFERPRMAVCYLIGIDKNRGQRRESSHAAILDQNGGASSAAGADFPISSLGLNAITLGKLPPVFLDFCGPILTRSMSPAFNCPGPLTP